MKMTHTELLFPPRLIPVLANLRGGRWQSLVEKVSTKPIGDLERKAFILLMARLAGCLNCQNDTWRAHQGCENCAKQTIRKFRSTDDDLIALYEACLEELKTAFCVELERNGRK